jgi:glucose/arabinose dehydrogenase
MPKRLTGASIVGVALVATLVQPATALPRGTEVKAYKRGLDFAVDMAWVPGTRKIFFTQKGGAVKILIGRRLLQRPCVRLPVDSSGERGALGIALHPRYKKNHRLYVYYTNASPLENRVARFVVRNNRCTRQRLVVRGIGSGSVHNGGQLEFMKGKLFVTVGENGNAARSQDPADRVGKILRYNPRGTIPDGNPFANAVWARGLRNPFGITHKPGTGKLFVSDNGPSCDDELNRIRKGANYGWGSGYSCGTNGVGIEPKGPVWRWNPVIAPTDLGWYVGRLKALSGTMYMGDYLNGRLYRFIMNRRDNRPTKVRTIYDHPGAILSVSKGPGRWLYLVSPGAINRIVRS